MRQQELHVQTPKMQASLFKTKYMFQLQYKFIVI